MAKIVIVLYTLYHHVSTIAKEVKRGIESTGNTCDIFQVPETLSDEVLKLMNAPEKPDIPIITDSNKLTEYDGVLFGIPTRFGNFPAQLKTFIDSTGGVWASGGLYHKTAGFFISTGTGGGVETTAINGLSTLAHHGMIYVPLGYAKTFSELTDLSATKGCSPWGSGTIAGVDGSRSPSMLEIKVAYIQGQEFAKATAKLAV